MKADQEAMEAHSVKMEANTEKIETEAKYEVLKEKGWWKLLEH
jgi:hypothetical protein